MNYGKFNIGYFGQKIWNEIEERFLDNYIIFEVTFNFCLPYLPFLLT